MLGAATAPASIIVAQLLLLLLLLCSPGDNGNVATGMSVVVRPGANAKKADHHRDDTMRVTGLYRYAVKGLSGDALDRVRFAAGDGETFPDDRRYALLLPRKNKAGTPTNGESDARLGKWVHKENFACAFTFPKEMSKIESSYSIEVVVAASDTSAANEASVSLAYPNDKIVPAVVAGGTTATTTRRLLTLKDRRVSSSSTTTTTPITLDLQTERGRTDLARYISERTGGKNVVSVVADADKNDRTKPHRHQFGNTSSGYKQRDGDTRTVHVINEATVRALSQKIGRRLRPSRFRPNIVVDLGEAWREFDWVANRRVLRHPESGFEMTVISKTVRCRGVSVDPLDLDEDDGDVVEELDIPELLIKHFPEHGPYLGVYAIVDKPGCLRVGDTLAVAVD